MMGEKNRIVMVYVDSYENDIPQGRFCIAANNEIQTFCSLMQLIKKINAELDKNQFPGAFDSMRMFQTPEHRPAAEKAGTDVCPGDKATFAVRILFRQNASWQGSVRWADGGQEESFRSVLELLFLMDSALNCKK